MGLFDSVLKGKEKTYKADPLAGDFNSAAKSGIGMLQSGGNELNDKIYNNAENFVDNQIGMENMLLRNASQDATRRTRDLIARRGMGTSSIGLGQEINQNRQLNEKLALNNASGMDRLKGLYQEKMQVGNQLMAPKMSQGPIQMQNVKTRQGGLAGLAGAAIGGYFGGAQGAQVGAGLGQMYQNS